MTHPRQLQRAFNGGELSPLMFGRIADASYQNGAALVRNFIPDPVGPVRNRPGLGLVREVGNSATKSRVIEFTYSANQQAVVEIGVGFFRFHVDGATVLFSDPTSVPAYRSSKAITTITLIPGEFNLVAHGFPDKAPIYLEVSSGAGPVPFPFKERQRYYLNVVSPDVFTLAYEPGGPAITNLIEYGGTVTRVVYDYVPGDVVTPGAPDVFQCVRRFAGAFGTGIGIYWRQVFDGDVYEIPNYYTEDDLFDVTFAQSLDVMTLTHINYPPSELRRLGPSSWTFTTVELVPQIEAPTGIAVSAEIGQYFSSITFQTGGPTTPIPNVLRLRLADKLDAKSMGFVEGATIELSTTATYVGNPMSGEYIISNDTPGSGDEFEISFIAGMGVLLYTGVAVSFTGSSRLLTQTAVDTTNSYKVTAVDEDGIESLPSEAVEIANNLFVTGASNVVTWAPVGGAERYRVYKRLSGIYGYIGQVDAGETLEFTDDSVSPDLDYTLKTIDTSLGTAEAIVTLDTTDDEVNWAGNTLENGYRVLFKTTNTLGSTLLPDTVYYVINRTVDTFQVSETFGGPVFAIDGSPTGTHFALAGDHPGAVAHFEQRRCFAGTLLHGHRMWMTRIGTLSDMTYTLPLRDDDRVRFDIDSARAGQIRHIVPMDHLILLSNAVEFRLSPLNTDAITPTSVAVRPQSYVGASGVRPALVNNALVYCAARGGHLREMGYQAAVQGFVTGDLSLRASHLFDDFIITDMAYAKAPRPVVWCVSSSGDLLGLSYVPEERVIAWHHHDTEGIFESCAVVTEGDEDRLYVVVKRTVNGVEKRFVERMSVQAVGDLEDAFYVDSGVTYDGTATTEFRNLTHLEGQAVVALADGLVRRNLTVVAQPAQTCTFDLGNDEVDLVAHGFAAGEAVTFATDNTLPTPLVAGKTYYVIAVDDDTFQIEYSVGSGAIDLGGAPAGTNTVTGSGRLTLPTAAGKVHVGRPYVSELKTLPILLQVDAAFGFGRTKNIARVWLDIDEAAPFLVGQTSDDLTPSEPILATAPALLTGQVDVTIDGEWDDRAQVFIRQADPLPVTIIDIAAEVALGG